MWKTRTTPRPQRQSTAIHGRGCGITLASAAIVAGGQRLQAGARQRAMTAEQITWGQLGCPRKTGLYRFGGAAVRVKTIHIAVAENDPAALFTVVAWRPPLGPPEYMLGHRVA